MKPQHDTGQYSPRSTAFFDVLQRSNSKEKYHCLSLRPLEAEFSQTDGKKEEIEKE